jgi:hypothetical protein
MAGSFALLLFLEAAEAWLPLPLLSPDVWREVEADAAADVPPRTELIAPMAGMARAIAKNSSVLSAIFV